VSEKNVVDSSGWLEYFTDSPQALLFAPAVEAVADLIVPTICVYEVYKKVRRERGAAAAEEAAKLMALGQIVDLDLELTLLAATYRLPLADSIIYATAMRFSATLWTQDEHFAGWDGVRYFAKPDKAVTREGIDP
jgi:predicted nucleic acid-binding protein